MKRSFYKQEQLPFYGVAALIVDVGSESVVIVRERGRLGLPKGKVDGDDIGAAAFHQSASVCWLDVFQCVFEDEEVQIKAVVREVGEETGLDLTCE